MNRSVVFRSVHRSVEQSLNLIVNQTGLIVCVDMKIDRIQGLISIPSNYSHYGTNELCDSYCQSIQPRPKADRVRGSEGTPKCWYCKGQEDETIDHFFLSCAKFDEIRHDLLQEMKTQLEALGEEGIQAWHSFERGSLSLQSQIILGVLSFGVVVDDVIVQFREQYVAKAWNERIVI